jgi:hypothetical protein
MKSHSRFNEFLVKSGKLALWFLYFFMVSKVWGQQPEYVGELEITVLPGGTQTTISLDAELSVFGSYCSWFPITHEFDSRQRTNTDYYLLKFVDRSLSCPPSSTGPDNFGYGLYSLTVADHSIRLDFRDADYATLTDYPDQDVRIYYQNGTFYDEDMDTISGAGTYNVWDALGKESPPKIPVTISNVSGTGIVVVDSVQYSSPAKLTWQLNGSHTISTFNSQTQESGQSTAEQPVLNKFGITYSFPSEPSNLLASSNSGNSRVRLNWSASQGTGVSYEIWRDLHMIDSEPIQEWRLIGTSTSTSYVDQDWIYNPSSGDYHINYKVRAKSNSNLYSTCAHLYIGAEYPQKIAVASTKKEFSFSQNHPNPFNPSTSLTFELAFPCDVRLVIYDIIGREVAVLTNGFYPVGRSIVTWDGTASGKAAPTGIYLARLEASTAPGGVVYSNTKKLLLAK